MITSTSKLLINFIRDHFQSNELIPLHEPVFIGNEKKYVLETINSTFVSSVGKFVGRFEDEVSSFTNSDGAVATINGTAALHMALILAGVKQNDYVITQPITFVATCNAIKYTGADPIFIDVDKNTLGLSPKALELWLTSFAAIDENNNCINKNDGRIIRACVPMHTFGHPVDLDNLLKVCGKWNLPIIEDAAESFGSIYKGIHTGTFGLIGTLSFNGNKIITTGGGGMILANKSISSSAKHLTTTAKKEHQYHYYHDEVGFNYRLPNINAALGCAQVENIHKFLLQKRDLAGKYAEFLKDSSLNFFTEPEGCKSNYWLNTVICENNQQRDILLKEMNKNNIMVRPIWKLMNELPMYSDCLSDDLKNSKWLEERIINLPSSVILDK